jgi:hypothetical protein
MLCSVQRLHFAECRAESVLTHGERGCPTVLPSTHEVNARI